MSKSIKAVTLIPPEVEWVYGSCNTSNDPHSPTTRSLKLPKIIADKFEPVPFVKFEGTKLVRILAGAGALIQITWRPETGNAADKMNWEHAAASAAAVQNLQLAAEARGMGSYWCSSKRMYEHQVKELCQMEAGEIYLGSLFFGAPLPDDKEESEGLEGKLRAKRTAPEEGWCKWIDVK